MNEISLYQPPRLIPELEVLVQRGLKADDDTPVVDGYKPWQQVSFHPAAEAAAKALRRDLEHRVSRVQVANWLKALATAVNQPPTQDEFGSRVSAVLASCDFPECLWSQESCVEAMRTFRFWPSVADIHELLQRRLDRHWRVIVMLDRMSVR